MSEMPGSRRLTPAQILLIVVVSVLVLLFVVLLAGRLGGGDERSAADASTTPAQAPAASGTATPAPREEDATPPAESEYFASPTGNIVCVMTVDSTECVISNFTYEATDAADCGDEGAGGHLRVEPAGASMPCEPLIVAGDVPSLPYGEAISAHGYTCESAESGVTCRHDESGYGFSVARASYELF